MKTFKRLVTSATRLRTILCQTWLRVQESLRHWVDNRNGRLCLVELDHPMPCYNCQGMVCEEHYGLNKLTCVGLRKRGREKGVWLFHAGHQPLWQRLDPSQYIGVHDLDLPWAYITTIYKQELQLKKVLAGHKVQYVDQVLKQEIDKILLKNQDRKEV
ncbi:MAG: hypothetical protein JSS66_07350 [Armatimonadetes bacterium]|nr:hypothetical protein [Armatimonadota bacterium]